MTPELKVRLKIWLEQQGYSVKSIDLLPRINYRRIVDGKLITEVREEDKIVADVFSQRGLHQQIEFYEVAGEEGLEGNTEYVIYVADYDDGIVKNDYTLVYELPGIF